MEKLKSLLRNPGGRLFLITEENVDALVMPLLEAEEEEIAAIPRLVIPAGEENKTIERAQQIWEWLLENGSSRSDTLICVGGGMLTDIGGFAAATFKRGMRHVNIATTLLAAADASVGGKTGVNMGGVKNCVGAFSMPLFTEVYAPAFATLPEAELLSGYGEMLKTAMIGAPQMLPRLLEPETLLADTALLGEIASECARIKMRIVESDPFEKGPRKVLNLGHTFGHALESLCMEKGRPVPHGVAVAHGLLFMMVMARMKGVGGSMLYSFADRVVKPLMKVPPVMCGDYARLLGLMHADKKNDGPGEVKFVLLTDAGEPLIDVPVDDATVEAAIDIYRDMGF